MNDYQFPSDTLFKTYQPDYVMHPFVSMHAVLASDDFKQENELALPVALGRSYKCEDGQVLMFDLADTNVLIGGACGLGKTVSINAIITSLLYKKRPEELKFVLIDPSGYNAALFKPLGERYLAVMEVTDGARSIISDCDDAIKTLDALYYEMENRFRLFMEAGVRNIVEYNEKVTNGVLDCMKEIDNGLFHHYLPYIVTIIDEYSDYMIQTNYKFDSYITRVAQLSKAVGMPIVISTQRPTVSIITGIIKANFNTSISFRTFSANDSRTILDTTAATYLMHRGEFYYSNGDIVEHVQCAYIDEDDIKKLVEAIAMQEYSEESYVL